MSLVKIIQELKKKVSHIRKYNEGRIITYSLEGKIVEEYGKVYFESPLNYKTNFEPHSLGLKKRRFLHSGRAKSAQIPNPEGVINSIIANAKILVKDFPYEVTYSEKEDILKIRVLKWADTE